MRNKTLAELVSEFPQAIELFEHAGLDYCCKGNRSLETACLEDGVSIETILQDLKNVNKETKTGNYSHSIELLIEQIVSRHHDYIRKMQPKLSVLLQKIEQVHGQNHPELVRMNQLFSILGKDLLIHIGQEEKLLFPRVVAMERNIPIQKLSKDYLSLEALINEMDEDHGQVGEYLKGIRELSQNFKVPEDACSSYRLCFQWLKEFEMDIHVHIHLENNVLFPMIRKKLNYAT